MKVGKYLNHCKNDSIFFIWAHIQVDSLATIHVEKQKKRDLERKSSRIMETYIDGLGRQLG